MKYTSAEANKLLKQLMQDYYATIDYRYANYDISAARKDYEELRALLSKAQTALDLLNNSAAFEIEL